MQPTDEEIVPLLLTIDDKPVKPPDPNQDKLPGHIPPEYKIRMVHDLGAYGL